MNLIFIYGPPAAGKLTVATQLAQLTAYPLLDNHRLLDYLPVVFPRSEPRFESVRSKLGRKIRLELFEAAASADVSMITTFAPISEGMHDFMRDVRRAVETAGGKVHFIQLLPSVEVLASRVTGESRRGRKIDTVERLYEVMHGNTGMFETFPDVPHLTIDNANLSPDEVARMIADHCRLSLVATQRN